MNNDEFEAMMRETAAVVRRSFESDWEVLKSEAVHYQIDRLIGVDPLDDSAISALKEDLDPDRDKHIRYRLQIHLDLLLSFKRAGVL
jgi:hypothetical protein